MFLTELPQDKYGNRNYTNSQAQVIEVEIEPVHIEGLAPYDHYRVLAPQSFVNRWSSVAIHDRVWIEVPGPVRNLTESEWIALLQQAGVEQQLIDWGMHRVPESEISAS